MKELGLLPFYFIIFGLIFFFITDRERFCSFGLFYLIIGVPVFVGVLVWAHLLRLIISDENISIILMFKNKTIKNLKKLKWNEIWFIDCRNQKYHITLVPKRETKEFQRFKWDELFIISSNYEKFSEIRETIIKNAPDAKVLPFNDKTVKEKSVKEKRTFPNVPGSD